MITSKSFARVALAAGLALAMVGPAFAGSYDAKALDRVVLKRSGATCAEDPNCFNRLHPKIPFVARAKPGQLIVFETRDAADSDFSLNTQFPRDLKMLSRYGVHPLTGPVYIEGASRGDVLAVTIVDIEPVEYGFTLIMPFGFAAKHFPGPPRIANWRLTRQEATTDQIPNVRIPYSAFPGILTVLPGDKEVIEWRDREMALLKADGVAPPPNPKGAVPAAVCGPAGSHKSECLRTIPPRENGGNMDAKYMTLGTTVLLPCFVDGCGLATGDVHYAQGDGEVAGTAIEMAATVTVRTEIRKGMGQFIKVPHLEGSGAPQNIPPGPFYATTGYPIKKAGRVPHFLSYLHSDKVKNLTNLSQDLTTAAQNALVEMIAYMVREHGLTRDQAYFVASVAVDIRITQVVDGSNYGALAILPLSIFRK
jgi:formamidase